VTQQAVERALGKLLTDENFRERFFTNPEIASWEAGFTLSPIELEALSQVSHEALARSLPRPRSPGGRKGGAHMTNHTVQEPAYKNGTGWAVYRPERITGIALSAGTPLAACPGRSGGRPGNRLAIAHERPECLVHGAVVITARRRNATYSARRFAISSRTIGTSSTGTSMAVWVVAS
jgi:hypothetical protein